MSILIQEIATTARDNGHIPEGQSVTITVNGKPRQAIIAPDELLVDFIRDTVGLTGTKFGCETGHCGACTVLVDGVSAKSCAMLAVQADGSQVTTIEGLAPAGSMSLLQECFQETHSIQCGFCTPGMVLSLMDLLQRNNNPSEGEIREWLDGTMCRCAVHQNAIRAVTLAAERLQQGGE